jgi:hypothetical protein
LHELDVQDIEMIVQGQGSSLHQEVVGFNFDPKGFLPVILDPAPLEPLRPHAIRFMIQPC